LFYLCDNLHSCLTLLNVFPALAFTLAWLESNGKTFGFKVHTCFYKKLLTANHAPELTPLVCLTDDWMLENLPANIKWERTATMGRGNELCNFH
jgi:hypothetical protein